MTEQTETRRAMDEQQQAITPEQARAILAQERDSRAAQCLAEIRAVLSQHRCTLTAKARITDEGRVVAYPEIVAEE